MTGLFRSYSMNEQIFLLGENPDLFSSSRLGAFLGHHELDSALVGKLILVQSREEFDDVERVEGEKFLFNAVLSHISRYAR